MSPPRPRRPHWVYDTGEEPDPRFSLANERTFLAWVRTSLAVAAGAVAMHSFGVPEDAVLRGVFVAVLLLMALTCTLLAWLRWARVERALRRGDPLPSAVGGPILALGTVTICLLAGIAVLV